MRTILIERIVADAEQAIWRHFDQALRKNIDDCFKLNLNLFSEVCIQTPSLSFMHERLFQVVSRYHGFDLTYQEGSNAYRNIFFETLYEQNIMLEEFDILFKKYLDIWIENNSESDDAANIVEDNVLIQEAM